MEVVISQSEQSAAQHSHLVRPQGMEWQPTRFPGCKAKTLLFDRTTGLMTALMRFAPGAALPDHEHVNIEQPGRPGRSGQGYGMQGGRIHLA